MILRIIFDQSDSLSHGYQVLEIRDKLDRDYTFLADIERCYFSLAELREEIAEKLQVDPAETVIVHQELQAKWNSVLYKVYRCTPRALPTGRLRSESHSVRLPLSFWDSNNSSLCENSKTDAP